MAFTNEDLLVKLYFNLNDNEYRIQDVSDYAGATPSIALTSVRGIYSLTDPNGNPLKIANSYSSPDVAYSIDTDMFSLAESFTPVEGEYTLVYYVQNALIPEDIYTKTFIFTYDVDIIPDVVISIESNVGLDTIESNDLTEYSDNITLNSRTHVLTYPAEWGSSSTTGAQIAITGIYTGEYTSSITSSISIDNVIDDLVIEIDITGTEVSNVWQSDGMYALRTALRTLYSRWETAITSNPKEGRRLGDIYNQVNANYTLFNSAKQNGDIDTAGTYLNNIKDLLAAEDIDTTIDPSVSVPVSSSLPGYASQWLSGTGAPDDSIGRIIDLYLREDNNHVYVKSSGSWVDSATLGANTIIQFSANGTSGWIPTYANGLNYIRFSGDGGRTWTVASKFIDGYIYIAYASDDSGTDFICTDETSFTFDASLEYIAIKKFDESHNGDLVVGDFSGLFTKYRDNGYSFSLNPGTVLVVTDADGNNAEYSNVDAEIRIYKGDTDYSSEFTFTKSATSNADGSLTDNVLTVSSITADTGYIDVICAKTGVTSFTIRIYVKKIKKGQAVVDITSVDSITIGLNGSDELEVLDNSIDDDKLILPLAESISNLNNSTYELYDSNGTFNFDVDLNNPLITIAWIDSNRFAAPIDDLAPNDVMTVEYNPDTKTFSVIGTNGGGLIPSDTYRIINLGKNRIAIGEITFSGLTTYYVRIRSFVNNVWGHVNSITFSYSAGKYLADISPLTEDTFVAVTRDNITGSPDGRILVETYNTSAKVGNTLTITPNSGYSIDNVQSVGLTNNRCMVVARSFNVGYTYYAYILEFDGTDWSIINTFNESTFNAKTLCKISDNIFSSNGSIYKIINDQYYLIDTGFPTNFTVLPSGYIIEEYDVSFPTRALKAHFNYKFNI